MLAQFLAIAVAVGSVLLFLTAFIFPKLHRQDDFFWSAVGLFYALILWVCAGQIAGAVLLAQLASVILLGWFAWETLRLRQAIIDPTRIPNLDKVSLVGYVKDRFSQPKPPAQPKKKAAKSTKEEGKQAPESVTAPPETPDTPTAETTVTPTTTEQALAPEATANEATTSPEAPQTSDPAPEVEMGTDEPEAPPATPETVTTESTPETPAAPVSTKKGFSFGRIFGRKEAPKAENNPQDLDDIFAEEPDVTEEAESPITESPESDANPEIETVSEAVISPDESSDTLSSELAESEGESSDETSQETDPETKTES